MARATKDKKNKKTEKPEQPKPDPATNPGQLPTPTPGPGLTTREGMGGLEVARTAETSGTAAAEHARAMIQAKFTVALARPRNIDHVRVRLLQHCGRPRFAEAARYSVPRGGRAITGWSIRFAEAALRELGNIHTAASVVYDDQEKRLVRVEVTDLESNTSYDMQVMVAKTIERKTVKQGEVAISERLNSSREVVYLVAAREDELTMKQAAIVSKALRTCGLRLVPSDILDECLEAVHRVDGEAPIEAMRKSICDGFAKLGIMPDDLEKYLGAKLSTVTKAQLVELRGTWYALRDGVTTWASVLEERNGNGGSKPASTGKLDADNLAGKGSHE